MGHVTSADVEVIDYLACVVCGNPTMPVSQSGPQRKTCDAACRVELCRRNFDRILDQFAVQDARHPRCRVGTKSLKALSQKLGNGRGAIKVPRGQKWEWQNDAGYTLVKNI